MTVEAHELLACPSCGASAYDVIRFGKHELRRCSACTLVYAPAYADPEVIYVDGYMEGATDFGLDISNPVFQRYLRDIGLRRVDQLEKVTGGPATLLDVGCGSGELLAAAQERRWTVAGVEPVEQSAATARARGLDVRTAMLQDSGFPERSYDVVSGFHVLEHMSEGVPFLQLIARWAKPGGYVCIEVPNWRSFARKRSGDTWIHLRPLEHLAHYEPKTLQATFERAGLEPVVVRTATYLWSEQSLRAALNDLGRLRWRKRLEPLCRTGADGEKHPTAPVRLMLDATRRAYDRAKVGQVVFGLARVPTGG